jgi:predicted neutral ceramidase superfamily lipid hydrolase
MEQLINQFETGLFIYQSCLLLYFILTPLAIFYIIKDRHKFKQPYVLIFLVIVFPLIVSIPAIIALNIKKVKV